MSRESTVKRREKGERTRTRILTEARRVLIEEGYDAVAVRSVADNVGIKLGNLQYYFPTRDHLLLEVMKAEAATDIEQFRSVGDTQQPPGEALANLVHVLVTKWRTGSGVVFSTLAFLRLHKPEFDDAYHTVYQAFYEELEQAIERAAPDLSPNDYRDRARLLTALIDGAAMQVVVGPQSEYVEKVSQAALQIALAPSGATIATVSTGDDHQRT